MKTILFIFMFLFYAIVTGQSGKDLDELINQVFTKRPDSGKDNVDLDDRGTNSDNNQDCECVAYYLCKNDTIITDGFGLIDIRINDGPCEDYLSVCCNPPDKVEKPITPPPPINKAQGCGIRNPDGVNFKITGDKDGESQFGEFPWMVALLREEPVDAEQDPLITLQCGASLIHPQVVLTAAHCFEDKEKTFRIRVGEWDSQTKNEILEHQNRLIERTIIHPQYNPGNLKNDIALVILDSPVTLEEHINTVCLPNQDAAIDHARCYATGWGKDKFGKEGKYQVILKKIDLPVVQRDLCQARLRTTRLERYFILDRSFLCAGGEEGKDTCTGDGGSPLACPISNQKNRYVQAGIVAWGIGCGENQIPGVYVDVAHFRNWIDQQMDLLNFDKSYYKY